MRFTMHKFTQSNDGIERCTIEWPLRFTREEYAKLQELEARGIDWSMELGTALLDAKLWLFDMAESNMEELEMRHQMGNNK